MRGFIRYSQRARRLGLSYGKRAVLGSTSARTKTHVWRFRTMSTSSTARSAAEFLSDLLSPREASRGQRLTEELRQRRMPAWPKREPLADFAHRAGRRSRPNGVNELSSISARPPESNYECPRCGARLLQARVQDVGGPPPKATCPICISVLPARAGDYLLEYKLIQKSRPRES